MSTPGKESATFGNVEPIGSENPCLSPLNLLIDSASKNPPPLVDKCAPGRDFYEHIIKTQGILGLGGY